MSKSFPDFKVSRVADMSNERIYLTEFWGGTKDGYCLQMTIGEEYVQLTKDDCLRLKGWLNDYTRGMTI